MHMMLLRFAQSLGGCSLASLCRWGTLPRFALLLGGRSLALLSRFPFNGSIKLLQNLHSRGSMKQHFYVWEPRCGYLLKVKKVSWCPLIEGGHRLTIILENVLVPPTPILKFHHIVKWLSTPQLLYYCLVYQATVVTRNCGKIRTSKKPSKLYNYQLKGVRSFLTQKVCV